MKTTLLHTSQFRNIMEKHIFQTITYLLHQEQEFAIACKIKYITFTPKLPTHIQKTLNETVLFVLSGYTYQSASLESEYFSFEAGFGKENFGSLVTVPLLSIKQIIIDDEVLLINFADFVPEAPHSNDHSMRTLLSNPKNKKLLKKKKENL